LAEDVRPTNEQLFAECKHDLLRALSHWTANPFGTPDLVSRIRAYLDSPDQTYDLFCRLFPVMGKGDVFNNDDLLKKVARSISSRAGKQKLIPAAGTSGGNFAFRLASTSEEAHALSHLSHTLASAWKIDLGRTLIINAYPAAVFFPPDLTVIETGPRPDYIQQIIDSFGDQFDHFVLIAQPHLLKIIFDLYPPKQSLRKSIRFILGGDWQPRNLGDYLATSLGLSLPDVIGRVVSLYGVAEIGLGVGIHTGDLFPLRSQLCSKNSSPMVFRLNSSRVFMESVNGQIVLTPLQTPHGLPLLRYNTGDSGSLIDSKQGRLFTIQPRNLPPFGNPDFSSEQLIEAIYGDPQLSRALAHRLFVADRALNLFTNPGHNLPDEVGRSLESRVGMPIVIHRFDPTDFDISRKPRYAKNG
jgi:hypothetical protein